MSLKNIITEIKININRSRTWVALLTSGRDLFIVLALLKILDVDIDISKYGIPLYFLVVLLLICVGYLDKKLGLHQRENKKEAERNPVIMEILERVKNIEGKPDKKVKQPTKEQLYNALCLYK